jgi:hypothetical protein
MKPLPVAHVKEELMTCKRLNNVCKCGAVLQVVSLWLTDGKALLVTAICQNCEHTSNLLFYLTDLYKGCPKPDPKELDKAIGQAISNICHDKVQLFTEEDLELLGLMNITDVVQ